MNYVDGVTNPVQGVQNEKAFEDNIEKVAKAVTPKRESSTPKNNMR